MRPFSRKRQLGASSAVGHGNTRRCLVVPMLCWNYGVSNMVSCARAVCDTSHVRAMPFGKRQSPAWQISDVTHVTRSAFRMHPGWPNAALRCSRWLFCSWLTSSEVPVITAHMLKTQRNINARIYEEAPTFQCGVTYNEWLIKQKASGHWKRYPVKP